MDRAVHQQGAAPPDTMTFGIPVGRDELRWQNVDVFHQGFLTFGGSEGFEGISGSGFHGVTFSVAQDRLETLADGLGMPFDVALGSSGVFLAAEQTLGTQPLAARALNYLRPKGGAEMSLSDEEEILTHFLYIADASDKFSDCSTGKQRARALRVSLEIMEANVAENVQISTICAMSGVSLRTLNRAYREAFGIGPKAYFLRMRLGLLRRSLLESAPATLVSDLANPLGFWHMGQLARDYRAVFGELPSETIA
ncbi:MAG: helix-turn-helix domain-containing protein [Marinosulfonomonas sp.]